MRTTPFQHQTKALKFHLSLSRSADFSEMGTGKTRVAIELIEKRIKRGETEKALIIVPASIIDTWAYEIDKHSDFLTYTILKGTNRKRLFEETDPHCYIISYDSLWKEMAKSLKEKGINFLILDEVHKVKNPKAKRTKLTIQLADRCKYVLMMSGTPTPNSMEDVWSLFRILDGGATFGRNFYKFLRDYFVAIPVSRRQPWLRKYKPRKILYKIVKSRLKNLAVRFRKQDLPDLPDKLYVKVFVNLSREQVKYYNKVALGLNIDEFKFELPPNILAQYEKLQQITSGFFYLPDGVVRFENPKIKAVLDMLPSLTANGKKTVIVCKYREEINQLREAIHPEPLVLSGDTINKHYIVNKFQTDPEEKVLVMQTSMGIGITLTAADSMVFLSNTFSYSDRYQSEDRIHRASQEAKKVVYYDIIAKGTLDEKILKILEEKRNRMEKIMEEVKRP